MDSQECRPVAEGKAKPVPEKKQANRMKTQDPLNQAQFSLHKNTQNRTYSKNL